MRTRRSPRNQDRLWRELGGTPEKPKAVEPSLVCWNCAAFPKHGRSRGTCAVKQVIVNGNSPVCEEFKAKSA